jgi:hemolysin activation/secretion protein
LREAFEVGGDATGVFSLASVGVVGGSQSFFVRGYPDDSLRGRRAVAWTAELRVPLLLVGRLLGHLPIGADKVSLSLFTDAGDAWDAGQTARLTRLQSVGAELVGDLTMGYEGLLRVRFGIAKPRELDPRVYLALGSAF